MIQKKIMFAFIYKMFIRLLSTCTIGSFGESLVSNSKGRLKFISLNNQPSQARPTLVNINSNQPLYYPFTVSVNKCGGSCNTIDDPYAWVCVSNNVKTMNVKVFNVTSGAKETRFSVQHESCECKCGLNESVCNLKQKRNHGECWCECKELDDWGSCKEYMWNPSTYDCESHKACTIDEYLDIKICSCKKCLFGK